MIALKLTYKHFTFLSRRISHHALTNTLSNAYKLYYDKFEAYGISEHLSMLSSIIVNTNSHAINDDPYVRRTIEYVIKHNTFDSTCKLLELVCLYKIPLAEEIFFRLIDNLATNFTIYTSSSSLYNNSIISLIYKSLKYRLEYTRRANISPIEDRVINKLYEFIKLYTTMDTTQLVHQTDLYHIDEMANCLFGSAHLLIKAGYEIDYVNIFNLFFSNGSTFLSPGTLISILYWLLDIKNDYNRMFTELSLALSYRLFMIEKSQGEILLQLLYMHRLKQRSENIQISDNRVYLLPQILRTR